MYIEQKLNPNSTEYSVLICMSVQGAGAEQAEAALDQVLAAHEALHSRFAERDGMPVRVIDKPPTCTHAEAASIEEARQAAEADIRPFD